MAECLHVPRETLEFLGQRQITVTSCQRSMLWRFTTSSRKPRQLAGSFIRRADIFAAIPSPVAAAVSAAETRWTAPLLHGLFAAMMYPGIRLVLWLNSHGKQTVVHRAK